MINKKFLSDHDIQLFQEALKHARPLKQKAPKLDTSFQCLLSPMQNRTPEPSSRFDTELPFQEALFCEGNEPCVEPEEQLFFCRTGLQKKQIQKLKKGQVPIRATIDLHGMCFTKALHTLEHLFSRQIIESGSHCFCIIHGKGQGIPVLKNLVNRFLKQKSRVLAFCSSPPSLGGTGATLVLLKSTK